MATLTLLACLLSQFVPRMVAVRRRRPVLVAVSVFVLPSNLALLPYGPAISVVVSLLLLWLLLSMIPPQRLSKGDRLFLAACMLLNLVTSYIELYSAISAALTPWSFDGRAGEEDGVEVIKAEQVGIYRVQVVAATRVEGMIEWLDTNVFRSGERDRHVLDEYVRRGWVFVTARVDTGRSPDASQAAEILVAPLIMRFPVDAPVYPLALTSTGGHETQILLYLLSQHRWTDEGRLGLRYAGNVGDLWEARFTARKLESVMEAIERDGSGPAIDPPGFFGDAELLLPYLCKFKGTLSPGQMEKDLVFTRAENDEFYRERLVRW